MLVDEFFSPVVCTVLHSAALGHHYSQDGMFLNALESQSIPDTETLSLNLSTKSSSLDNSTGH